VRVRAFALINLVLRVLGLQAGGYHELRTVFQSIALYDTLTIRRERGPFRLTCDDPRLPVDRRNLLWRAADAMWKATGRRGRPRDVTIDLTKRIPLEAGLGGGSSDAAAALRALATIWRVSPARIRPIAASLGADVPYFLEGGTVLGLERGDLLFPLADPPRAWVVLVVPPFGVSTAEAYGWFDRDHRASRSTFDKPVLSETLTLRQAQGERRVEGPVLSETLTLRQPQGERRVEGLRMSEQGELGNDLQISVARRHPEIAGIVSALRRAGAAYAAMSGSGSAVFGLFDGQARARAAQRALATQKRRTFVIRTLTRAECRKLAAK
jgi:4-diphosphocytidyl-2-C-methyl-D-erythritol kinase